MKNLLQETKEMFSSFGKIPDDIVFIGSVDGYQCTWGQYKILADFGYDNGYGSQNIPKDLIIIFNDNSWLSRAEYDGSEWWRYNITPKVTGEYKQIKTLENKWGNDTLSENHEPKNYEDDKDNDEEEGD